MYFNGNITFKGITSGSLGIIVSSMPKMQHSAVKATEYDIPLRDGIQYSSWRNRTDAQITVKFAIVKDNNTNYIQTLRATRQWLEGTGQLILDNNPDVYYNVKKVEITDEEMYTLSSGELEATFVVEPFEYMIEDIVITETFTGQTEKTVSITNDGDLCMPIIQITNPYNFQFELTLGVANQPRATFVIQTEGMNFVCDTKLMITIWNGLNKEIYFTSHNYDDLWVKNGTNNVYIKFKPTQYISGSEFTFTFNARRGFAT